jgi:GDP-mannose 6-dehydrogenase
VAIRVAEMLKYSCNCYHGLKVAFANEIGNVCKALGVDSHEVMRLFCQDTKLNVSAAYLKPGFAFGGSCLPKDLRAVVYRARQADVDTPVLSATLVSNRRQIERAFEFVLATGKRRVGILGLAFKAGTDDLRESPMVALSELLLGKGLELRVVDHEVQSARVIGANKEFVEREIPHIWELMAPSAEDVAEWAEVLVVGSTARAFKDIGSSLRPGQVIIDLARAFPGSPAPGVEYVGIAW